MSANTVSPPTARWPTATSGATPSGRKRSVRLPKRIRLADDTPGHQSGDLYHADPPAVLDLDQCRLALVVLRGLVERGVDERARVVLQAHHGAVDRDPVDVHVEDVEENADPGELRLAQAQLRRRLGRADPLHAPVGRGDH
jgi:hypothetical protein